MCEPLTVELLDGHDGMGHAGIMPEWVSVIPRDEAHWLQLRTKCVNSTEISALFGQSPYMTKAELWYAKKSGEVQAFETNERMLWGQRLQDSIAHGLIEDKDWCGRKMPEYIFLPIARMGSSFDWRVQTCPDYPGVASDSDDDALLEIKNVDGLAFRDGWAETDFGLEAPAHIEMQIQHEMHVSRLLKLWLAALIGGNRVVLLERNYDPEVGAAMQSAVEEFWLSIDSNTPPPFDFENDAELISRLYATVAGGKAIVATPRIEELMADYSAASETASAAESAKKTARAELLTLIGDAEKVSGIGFNASAGMVDRKSYVVQASSYRTIRVTKNKEKAA